MEPENRQVTTAAPAAPTYPTLLLRLWLVRARLEARGGVRAARRAGGAARRGARKAERAARRPAAAGGVAAGANTPGEPAAVAGPAEAEGLVELVPAGGPPPVPAALKGGGAYAVPVLGEVHV